MIRGCLAQYFYSMNGRIQWSWLKIIRADNLHDSYVRSISDSFRCQEDIFTCGIYLLFASSSATIHLVSHASRCNLEKSIQM